MLEIIKKKGFFPYDYWDSFENVTGLSSKNRFHNSLTNHATSAKNYKHVLNIWKAFKMKTTKDYHDLYLEVDVLSLACVFEAFRKESMNSFEFDPNHYLSTPGYSWDAMLRFTDVNVKLMSDIKKYQFIESILIGGVSMICLGYAEVNNELLKL